MGTNQLDAGRPLDQLLIYFAMSELVGSAAYEMQRRPDRRGRTKCRGQFKSAEAKAKKLGVTSRKGTLTVSPASSGYRSTRRPGGPRGRELRCPLNTLVTFSPYV
jgi:hypothetical protein